MKPPLRPPVESRALCAPHPDEAPPPRALLRPAVLAAPTSLPPENAR
jgi:hypothetical protein